MTTTTSPSRRAVYTALMGGYETLLPQPLAQTSDCDFICFTDDADLRSDDWTIVVVAPVFRADHIRSARSLKIVGHESLADYDETLWIDNRVCLLRDPSEILDEWLSTCDVVVPQHSFRADVLGEFQAVLDAGLDEAARLYEQLTHYSVLDAERLRDPAPWTGILARRRTPRTTESMELWFRHVLRYSRRDQLSFVQTMHETRTSWSFRDVDNLGSDLHEWRTAIGRSRRPTSFQIAAALQPPVAEVGQLRQHLDNTVTNFTADLHERDAALHNARAETDLLRVEAQRQSDEVLRLRRRLSRVRRSRRELAAELERGSDTVGVVSRLRRTLRRDSSTKPPG